MAKKILEGFTLPGSEDTYIFPQQTIESLGAAKTEDLNNHISNKENPHEVTAEQVGSYSKLEEEEKMAQLYNYKDFIYQDSYITKTPDSTQMNLHVVTDNFFNSERSKIITELEEKKNLLNRYFLPESSITEIIDKEKKLYELNSYYFLDSSSPIDPTNQIHFEEGKFLIDPVDALITIIFFIYIPENVKDRQYNFSYHIDSEETKEDILSFLVPFSNTESELPISEKGTFEKNTNLLMVEFNFNKSNIPHQISNLMLTLDNKDDKNYIPFILNKSNIQYHLENIDIFPGQQQFTFDNHTIIYKDNINPIKQNIYFNFVLEGKPPLEEPIDNEIVLKLKVTYANQSIKEIPILYYQDLNQGIIYMTDIIAEFCPKEIKIPYINSPITKIEVFYKYGQAVIISFLSKKSNDLSFNIDFLNSTKEIINNSDGFINIAVSDFSEFSQKRFTIGGMKIQLPQNFHFANCYVETAPKDLICINQQIDPIQYQQNFKYQQNKKIDKSILKDGLENQFLLSDGNGGIKFETLINRAETGA